MGLKYLGGLSWSEVTRDECFFCQHLFSLIQLEGIEKFVDYLINEHDAPISLDDNWEAAYEVHFYRDFWHHKSKLSKRYSFSRTFDLCLFSDNAIAIIEAKAHQEFDPTQLKSFKKDENQLKELTKVSDVLICGLAR